MGQTLWLYFREDATETELAAWDILKENSKDQSILTIEVTSEVDLEREHQRLVDEGCNSDIRVAEFSGESQHIP